MVSGKTVSLRVFRRFVGFILKNRFTVEFTISILQLVGGWEVRLASHLPSLIKGVEIVDSTR